MGKINIRKTQMPVSGVQECIKLPLIIQCTNIRLYLSHDIKLRKNTFWRENVKTLPSFVMCYIGRHNIKLLNL